MLTEHAEAVHSQLVDKVEDLRYSLCNLFLKLLDDLNNVIISKDCLHSDYNFSHNKEDILFYLKVNHLEKFFGVDSNRLQTISNDIEKNIVHTLCILNSRVGKGKQYFSQKIRCIQVLLLVSICSVNVLLYLYFFCFKWLQ